MINNSLKLHTKYILFGIDKFRTLCYWKLLTYTRILVVVGGVGSVLKVVRSFKVCGEGGSRNCTWEGTRTKVHWLLNEIQ